MRDTRRPDWHTELEGMDCPQHGKAGGHSVCNCIVSSYFIVLCSEKLGLVLTLQFCTVTNSLEVSVTSIMELPIADWKVWVFSLGSQIT